LAVGLFGVSVARVARAPQILFVLREQGFARHRGVASRHALLSEPHLVVFLAR